MNDTPWIRPRPGRRGYRNDAILAVVLAAGMAVSTLLYSVVGYYPDPAQPWVSALCIAASTLPLIVRRRYPSVVAVVVAAAFIFTQSLSVPELLIVNIALFIALYSVGAWGGSRLSANLVRALIVVVMFGWIGLALYWQASDPSIMEGVAGSAVTSIVAFGTIQVITNGLYFGGAWYFGDRAWAAAREQVVLKSRTDELTRERELTAQQAISLERVRIARELHDVVAHHVSVMGLQAGAARRVLDSDPAMATASLAAIESSARSAVEELHHLLTTLRDVGGGGGADDSPSVTGIEHLGPLVDLACEAGVSARFVVIGVPRAVPATVDATAYRIAQEAVTNTLKHAGAGAAIDMRLRYLDGEIEIEVSDVGGRGHPARKSDSGLGLVGMRERVAAVGGALQVGPRARGGYLVRATLPALATGVAMSTAESSVASAAAGTSTSPVTPAASATPAAPVTS